MKKIVIIRIRGTVNVPKYINQSLDYLRLRQKFVCIVIEDNKENLGRIKAVKDYVAFGEIDEETLRTLILKRGRKEGDQSVEAAGKTIDEFVKKFLEGKSSFEDIKIKSFFRLHPPVGGFKKSIKKPFPEGVLGNQGKLINKLVQRML
jgi:large subunit ribosomal protein L30